MALLVGVVDLTKAITSSLNCLNRSYTSLLFLIKYCTMSLDVESINPNMYMFMLINDGVLKGPLRMHPDVS